MNNVELTAEKLKKLISKNRHNLTSSEVELLESIIKDMNSNEWKTDQKGVKLLLAANLISKFLKFFGLPE